MKLAENQCLCPQCKAVKTYTEKVRERNKSALCRSCAKTKKEEDKKRYKRICDICGDVKEVRYRPTSNRCADCSRKEIGANLKKSWHKRESGNGYGKIGVTNYTYFCPKCPHIRISGVRRKTSLCGKCARTDAYRFRWNDYFFNFETMTMETVVLREKKKRVKVSKKKTKDLSLSFDRIMKPKQTPAKKKKKSISKANIERIREVNRKHREAQVKPKEKPKTGHRTYDEDKEWQRKQIDDFLKRKGATVIEDNKVTGDFYVNSYDK